MSEGLAHHINQVRTPFNVNTIAQVAAIAALDDETSLRRTFKFNLHNREWLRDELTKRGFSVTPGRHGESPLRQLITKPLTVV